MLPQSCLHGTHLHLPRLCLVITWDCLRVLTHRGTLCLHRGSTGNAGELMSRRPFHRRDTPASSPSGRGEGSTSSPRPPQQVLPSSCRPQAVTGLITYLLLASFSSLSRSPTHLLVFLGTNSQIKLLTIKSSSQGLVLGKHKLRHGSQGLCEDEQR